MGDKPTLNSIWEKISQEQKKVSIHLTIDEALLNKIKSFQKKFNIKQLSPTVNELLWDSVRRHEQIDRIEFHEKLKEINNKKGEEEAIRKES